MRLLTIDWDYFFPNALENGEGGQMMWLMDWGHQENELFLSPMIWDGRGAAFLRAGLGLPRTSGREAGWWGQFRFMPGAELWVTDSHSLAGTPEVIEGVTQVWSFDAHHDLGYRDRDQRKPGDWFECGSWLQACTEDLGVRAHVRYPLWKTAAFETDRPPEGYDVKFHYAGERMPRFDRVHVCRSGAWTPTWLDEEFVDFVRAADLPIRRPEARDIADPLIPRGFNPEPHLALYRSQETPG